MRWSIKRLNAVSEGWISHDDLKDEEASIYFALPALTLLEAINQSYNCKGIKLLNDKMLTIENCPKEENFGDLFIPILKNKEQMRKLSENEIKVVKLLCLSNNHDIPTELNGYRTKHATECVAIINKIASTVSQRSFFKDMIKSVIDLCLDSLNQQKKLRQVT